MGAPHVGGTPHYGGGYGYRGGLNNTGYRGNYYGGSGFGYPYSGGFGGYPYGGYGYGGYGYGGLPLGYGAGGLGYGYGMGSGYSNGYRSSTSGYYSATPAVLGARPLQPSYPAEPDLGSSEPAPAIVTLNVPVGATIWFDGKETPMIGGGAVFTSPVMKPGSNAVLNVKARWNDSTREMNLPLKPGDKMTVDLRNQ